MAEKQQAEDVILKMADAKRLAKSDIDLGDEKVRAALEEKGAVFTKGRAGSQIPFSALVALDYAKPDADPFAPAPIRSSRRPSLDAFDAGTDVALAEDRVRNLQQEHDDLTEQLGSVKSDLREAKKAVTAARLKAEREHAKQSRAAEREQAKAEKKLATLAEKRKALDAEEAALRKQVGK